MGVQTQEPSLVASLTKILYPRNMNFNIFVVYIFRTRKTRSQTRRSRAIVPEKSAISSVSSSVRPTVLMNSSLQSTKVLSMVTTQDVAEINKSTENPTRMSRNE